ncbi:MAG: hypothetical protein ACJ746_13250 [Bryobacteraceae bacterium]
MSVIVSDLQRWTRHDQNVAIGFNGDPVPPFTGIGAALTRNSRVPFPRRVTQRLQIAVIEDRRAHCDRKELMHGLHYAFDPARHNVRIGIAAHHRHIVFF